MFSKKEATTLLTVTTARAPVFSVQPTDTDVSAIINVSVGVKVQLFDNLNEPLPNQNVTISIGTNPPALMTPSFGRGTIYGTLIQATDASGIATFTDLKIDWLGQGYTLVATANPISGLISGTSAGFNELRVGDPCLGPESPSCEGTCLDTDGDGLS